MITNRKGETLISLIIGIIIISIILTSLAIVLNSSYYTQVEYINKNKELILNNNARNIGQKINLENIDVNETFYVYKNTNEKKFEVYTGLENSNYRYIDINGENVGTGGDLSNIYSREYKIENEDDFLNKKNKILGIILNNITKN